MRLLIRLGFSCPRVWRLFALGDGYSGFGESHRAGTIRGAAVPGIDPADFSCLIDDKGYRRGNEAAPVTLLSSTDRADQLPFRITEETQGIGVETDVRTVFLAVTRHPLSQLSSLFRRLDADAEDLDLFGNVSFRFINEGRHLGPAPGSPAATVEKDHGCRRPGEDLWKIHGLAVDVLKLRRREFFADCQLSHFSPSTPPQ